KPSLHQINHVLVPIIDDLLEFWDPGFQLSETPMHPAGRLIKGALIFLVCDLPALRQMGGFASYGATPFCSFCTLTIDNIDDLQHKEWELRTCVAHRSAAAQWRDAQSEDERMAIFEQNGVRWSELLRLPYWDPTLSQVVDTMHNLFLGDFMRHCRVVWGMD
ncbi:hypothetical protein BD410DRAFT_696555, partial [Rickenella mellea]